MIAYIHGILAEKEPSRVIVEAAGIGYEIFIPLSTYDRLPKTGAELKLLTAHIVREDDEQLFGFATPGERELFAKLLGVSGVGAKTALSILSGLSQSELAQAIASGDAKRISTVKGVGRKTAEKICVELRDKVNALEAFAGDGGDNRPAKPFLRDAVLALTALGFAEDAATAMVAAAMAAEPNVADAETLIRLALTATRR